MDHENGFLTQFDLRGKSCVKGDDTIRQANQTVA